MATATTFRPETKRIVVNPGDVGVRLMPHSEACAHMGVAGRPMSFRITEGRFPMAQLYRPCGTPFSAPVTLGEAGIYSDAEGLWYPKDNLVVHCEEQLLATRQFADQVGLRDNLEEKLHYLATYSDRPSICFLHRDFAPWSFQFVHCGVNEDTMKLTPWFNGGLIYSGPDCPADGSSPSLTVSLTSRVGWSTHT